jgi:hypothetical protein
MTIEDSTRSGCPSCETLIAYASGELSEDQTLSLRSHLVNCKTCRKAISGWLDFKNDLEDSEDSLVSESFVISVIGRLDVKPPKRNFVHNWWPQIAGVLVVIILFRLPEPHQSSADLTALLFPDQQNGQAALHETLLGYPGQDGSGL